ncbi:hypothetical protein RvY_16357 [Ramazzottius varieornatus]|uniref:maleylacetoacetate isomerase n=1 Tax=Ramazzottius varieornatus TaxID=947166 RepID=A0A1D1W2J4_RAMVA|nr:hypothetical protein RvY_16357 [Ramazzottius varieornatus]
MRISLCRLAKLAQKASRMNVKESVSTKTKPVLYGYAKSSCSWRVRAALFHKNIDYDLQPYDPWSPQADKEAYMKMNGLGQVPTLIIDGHLLTQSIAILEYLEEKHRENPLLPKDSMQRARVRQIVELINSGIQPLQNPTVAKRVSEDPEKQKEWQVYFIEKGLKVLETMVGKDNDKFCVGSELTFADLCFVPQMFASRRFGGNLAKFPKCNRLFEELLKLEVFRHTHPNNQPDTPDELRGVGPM